MLRLKYVGSYSSFNFFVSSFSVSKWIHLNGGDDGLLAFFRRVHSCLNAGGSFVLEPQSWEGYSKAKRMSQVIYLAYCDEAKNDDAMLRN